MKKGTSIVLLLALLLQSAAPSAAAAPNEVIGEKTVPSAAEQAAPNKAGISPMSLFEEFDVGDVRYREITDQAGANEVMIVGMAGTAPADCAVTIPPEVKKPGTEEMFRVTRLQTSAFTGGVVLSVTLPDSITEIPAGAFQRSTALETVVLPDGVTAIGDMAFQGSAKLTSVNFPVALQTIGDAAFNGTGLGGDIDLTHCTQLTAIGQTAFGGSSATSFIMPNSVTELGAGCFSESALLQSIQFSKNLTALPNNVLSGCAVLTAVTFPPALETLGASAMSRCKAITAIALPTTVTSIGSSAFNGCTALETIAWPAATTTVSPSTFYGCTKLAQIEFPEGVTAIDSYAFNGCTALKTVTLPSTLQRFGEAVFQSCTKLTSVNIPSGVTALPKNMFSDCAELMKDGRNLILPDSITYVGDTAFRNIRTFDIRTTSETLAKYLNTHQRRIAPQKTSSTYVYLNDVRYTASETLPPNVREPFSEPAPRQWYTYTPLSDNTVSVGYDETWSDSDPNDITFPETIINPKNGVTYDVVKVQGLNTDVKVLGPLPTSITQYGLFGLSRAYMLEEHTMSDAVTTLEQGVFKDMGALKKVTLSQNLENISETCFYNCTALETLVIPESVKSIDRVAFGKTKLNTLNVPDDVTELGEGFAQQCPELTTVTMGAGVKSIPTQAFVSDSKLSSVSLPENLEEIQTLAFGNTPALQSIVLPETLKTLGEGAFYKSGLKFTKLPKGTEMTLPAFDSGEIFVETETQLAKLSQLAKLGTETYHTIVDKVTIGKTAPSMIKKGKLTATVKGTYSDDVASIDWSSSDPTIAAIDKETGEVTVLKDGDVTFTATSRYGKTLTTDANGIITAAVPAADSVKISAAMQEPSSGGDDDIYYTVTFHAGENGSISGAQSYQVRAGGRLTAVPNITPNKGFEFLGWSTDGKTTADPRGASVTKNAAYTALYRKQNPGDLLDYNDHTVPFIQGDNRDRFRPEDDITRAEVAAIFNRIMPQSEPAPAAGYRDVARDAWYASAVDRLTALGIFSGYPDGTFRPEQPISRSELTAVIARFADPKEAQNAAFTDVDGDFWAAQYIQTAAAYGWVQGYPDGTFRPMQSIVRAETVAMVDRLLGRRADTAYIDANTQHLNTFPDLPASHWAYYDVMEAANGHEHTTDPTETWQKLLQK